jgi:hypothetical protein
MPDGSELARIVPEELTTFAPESAPTKNRGFKPVTGALRNVRD